MKNKFLNKFLPAASLLAVFALYTVSFAEPPPPYCHHAASDPADHSSDEYLPHAGHGHQNDMAGHEQDHAPIGPDDCGAGTSGTATPEPVTMILFGAGLAGVGYAARRRKRQAE